MAAISRYDPSMGGYGKSIEGMLVLTELRLLFLPDISCESATASFVEFHTVQVRSGAISPGSPPRGMGGIGCGRDPVPWSAYNSFPSRLWRVGIIQF